MNKDPSEIAKLTERISKDPKSKLFVPLAEEYKKVGDIEMAVHVLLEGLKQNPGYVTAKSFLGRLLLEKGDLPGAQKEFEEVVKAIPDNLLAQRKLGDLYALQNKQAEALKQYKIVLALSPGDEDLASLVSDVESGADVRQRLQQQKTKPSPEPPKKPVSPQKGQATASSPQENPEVVKTPLAAPFSTPEPKPEREHPPLHFEPSSGPADTGAEAEPAEPEKPSEPAAQGLTSLSAQLETEEPEEVLVVEPLEEEQPVEAVPSPGIDFFAEKTPADIAAAPFEETPVMPEPGPAAGQTVDQSDDFTTDTLAELYIAQGFFEKAIDIYQRMLADHPNSRGLANKLDRVKTMAAAAEASAPTEYTPVETGEGKAGQGIFAELNKYPPTVEAEEKRETTEEPLKEKTGESVGAGPKEYIPPEEPVIGGDEVVTLEAELLVEAEDAGPGDGPTAVSGAEDLFAESREYSPATETEPADAPKSVMEEMTVDDKSYDIFMPPQEAAREEPLHTDFGPREYVPPEAGPRGEKREKVHAAPKQQAIARKETIDRLENWLKNIVKEK